MSAVKDLVAQAVKQEWSAFETQHPRLAAVVDEMLLVEGAVAELADDPEYAQVLGQAQALGTAAEEVGTFVRQFVGQWMRRLIG